MYLTHKPSQLLMNSNVLALPSSPVEGLWPDQGDCQDAFSLPIRAQSLFLALGALVRPGVNFYAHC